MRVVVGITGASGAIFGVEFLKRCPAEEKYVILTRWGRSLLKSEAGVSPEDLAPFARKVYSTDDMSSPLASGSNPFDAMVILPCSVATLVPLRTTSSNMALPAAFLLLPRLCKPTQI